MVECLEVFGNDLTVVNAARVSFAKESLAMTLADEKLIRYLAKHNHNSPFFHPQLRFRFKMPLFVAREWFRHTIGFARNEVSRRYVSDRPDCWIPAPHELRQKDPNVKQGSRSTPVANADQLSSLVREHTHDAVAFYEYLLGEGVAPEVARSVLPQSMYTEFIETGSLAAYARLVRLRDAPDAQAEIRWYAGEVANCVARHFPISWAALTTEWETESTCGPTPTTETK